MIKAFGGSINNSLVYFLCCNSSYWKLAVLAMSLLASQELPLRGWAFSRSKLVLWQSNVSTGEMQEE